MLGFHQIHRKNRTKTHGDDDDRSRTNNIQNHDWNSTFKKEIKAVAIRSFRILSKTHNKICPEKMYRQPNETGHCSAIKLYIFRLLHIFALLIFRVSFFSSFIFDVQFGSTEMHSDAQNEVFFSTCVRVPCLPKFSFSNIHTPVNRWSEWLWFFLACMWMRPPAGEYVGSHKFKFITFFFSCFKCTFANSHLLYGIHGLLAGSVGRLLLVWVMFTLKMYANRELR